VKIDSLDHAIAQADSGDEREKLEQIQIQYTMRRMQVTPDLPELSFDPFLIETIRVDTVQTVTERAIYIDFLNRAHQELEHHYNRVDELESNIHEMIRLEEKTIAFMEDIEDGTILPVESSVSGNRALNEFTEENIYSGGANRHEETENLVSRIPIRSVLLLNHQLSGLAGHEVALDELETMSVEERLQLLEQTKKSLKHYLNVTAEKLCENPSVE
jgi:hypothetical protein